MVEAYDDSDKGGGEEGRWIIRGGVGYGGDFDYTVGGGSDAGIGEAYEEGIGDGIQAEVSGEVEDGGLGC